MILYQLNPLMFFKKKLSNYLTLIRHYFTFYIFDFDLISIYYFVFIFHLKLKVEIEIMWFTLTVCESTFSSSWCMCCG